MFGIDVCNSAFETSSRPQRRVWMFFFRDQYDNDGDNDNEVGEHISVIRS